jgi:hypothetical protein
MIRCYQLLSCMISTTLAVIRLKIQAKFAMSVVSTPDIHSQLPVHTSLSESAAINEPKLNQIVKLCAFIAECGAVAAYAVEHHYQ